MIPLKLTLRGFLTYRDEETLDFEGVRTAVIIGDNGHGKSALFDAVTYALFGKHRGSQTRYLVNQECRELAVRFEFEADDRRYRVDRALTLSPRKNGVPTVVATGYIFDGVDWQAVAHGVAECDEWVKDVLGGMTYEICCQSILLRQGAHDKFLSAKPLERQLVLNTLLNFEPYRRLQQAARARQGKAKGIADGLAAAVANLTLLATTSTALSAPGGAAAGWSLMLLAVLLTPCSVLSAFGLVALSIRHSVHFGPAISPHAPRRPTSTTPSRPAF